VSARRVFALVALSLPIFVLSVDANGVVVLLPQIAHDLGVSNAAASAVITAQSLAFAAPLLLIGRLADRFGARPLLLGGVLGFAAASAVCASADSMTVMLAGRALQGASSACCFTTSLAAIDALFDADRQPIAVGIWGAIGGVGSASGPLVASVLAQIWSWRAFFAVNVAVLGAAAVLLAVLVPPLPSNPERDVPLVRLVVLLLGIGFSVGGMQRAASAGWSTPGAWGGIAVGVAFLALTYRLRRPDDPLVPASVTRLPSFRLGTAEATLSNWGSGVVMVLVPTALAVARGIDVLDTGLLFLAFSILFALGGACSGPLVRARGGPATLELGMFLLAVGMVALAVVGPDGALGLVLLTLAVAGYGNGIVYSASTSYALVAVAPVDAGEASAALSMLRVLGLALAVALSTSLMTNIDDEFGGSWGLRVALLVAAAVVVGGLPLTRRAPAGVESPR